MTKVSRKLFDCIEYGFWGKSNLEISQDFHQVKQVHKAKIAEASHEGTSPLHFNKTEADGLFTEEENKTISIKTADCLPILLFCYQTPLVMALHGGWRSLATNIITNGLNIFKEKKIPLHQVRAVLGPCISRSCYEVGSDVIDAFHTKNQSLTEKQIKDTFYKSDATEKWFLDLAQIAYFSLENHGVPREQIILSSPCTYSNSTSWYSYRKEGPNTGRNWSWIKIIKKY